MTVRSIFNKLCAWVVAVVGVLAIVFVIVLLSFRAGDDAYHTRDGAANNCVSNPDSEACVSSYYQEYKDYDVAFAEFTERGNAFKDKHIENVLRRIKERAEDTGMVLVVFVHGWTHNASEDDCNLIDFKQSLQTIADSGELSGQRVIGLYVGWRGASITLPGLENITFWDRKAVAEEVGKGGVTRLFLELEKVDSDGNHKNVFVVVGHSFGGAIVVSALTEVLTERVVHRTETGNFGATVGDAVMVVNPAIEANQALPLVEAAIEDEFPDKQHPLFVSVSTDADIPTHYAFPAGQTFGLLLTWHQHDLVRSYYYDREGGPDVPVVLREEHLDSTTVGNFAPFLTHSLTSSTDANEEQFVFEKCADVPERCEPKGLTLLSGQPTIKNSNKNYPLFFIKTDEIVMSGHSDIFNDKIQAFMLTVIKDVVKRSLSGAETTTILNKPELLIPESNKIYKKLQALGPRPECS